MNAILKDAISAAETLRPEDQRDLAEAITTFVAARASDPNELLTDTHRAELRKRLAAPFAEADPAAVEALFRKYA